MVSVASEEVAAFRPLCSRIAKRYHGLWGSEFDDLEQEAMIAVWSALKDGYKPTTEFVENRVRNWVAYCRRKGFTGYDEESEES